MKTSSIIYLFMAAAIGFLGNVSVANACNSDEWCCKHDFSQPGNPCVKCCSKNYHGASGQDITLKSNHTAQGDQVNLLQQKLDKTISSNACNKNYRL